ncbi:MAG: hypothetical protein LBE05_05815 [Microbacterium sp.]|nr:hypothetical protein [Microbacterium sp.]
MPCTLPNAVPTDDEREALEQVVAPILDAAMGGYSSGTYDDYAITDAVLAAGFRRTVQGEPSPDAQALLADADALVASWDRKGSWSADSPVGMVMQLARALRAAVVSVQGKAPGVEALEAFLSKLAGSGAYTLNFGSANELFEDIVRALRRDIEALRAAASSPVQAPEGEVK